jgi:hypothetical protein
MSRLGDWTPSSLEDDSIMPAVASSTSSKSIMRRSSLSVSYAPTSSSSCSPSMEPGAPRLATRAAYSCMESPVTLRTSISAATSRSVAVSTRSRQRSAARPSIRPLNSSTRGAGPPTTIGQKWLSCARAAEWKVRAGTPPAPSARNRARSSAAARVVKVSAITRAGS